MSIPAQLQPLPHNERLSFDKPRNKRDYDEIGRDAATKALLDAVRSHGVPLGTVRSVGRAGRQLR